MEGTSQLEIVIRRFGVLEEHKVNEIINTMRSCYSRLAPSEIRLVDLYIFAHSSGVEAFLSEESRRVGVASSSFDDLFFSMHDAWTGISRIIVCLERMKKLSTLAQKGGIHHEVGHSVLHGSLAYYIFSVPLALQDLAQRFRLSRQYVTNMLYLISIAVKDYEVSRLLHEHGFDEDQIALAKHLLTPTESDRTTWEISRENPRARALCLTSYMKLIGHATPFLTLKPSRRGMIHYLRESLAFLPKEYASMILGETPQIFQQLKLETSNNVDTFTRLVIERILQPLYEADV
ncbi:MAG: hypothetical protein JSV87_04355 [Candidatus Bathyarchaeota archaeon]|nr:MAG: hypothetical protein JSV87_04355 [Candidatus Bathyarchaeota archaeon]